MFCMKDKFLSLGQYLFKRQEGKIMKPGDMIQYRTRKESDPHPDDVGKMGKWETTGIIVRLLESTYPPDGKVQPSIEYIDDDGDWIICKQEDVKVIGTSKCVNQVRYTR